MSDQKPLNISHYMSFSFLAVLSLTSSLSADPTINDFMGYSTQSAVRCNPIIAEKYFMKHPEKKGKLGEDLEALYRDHRSSEIAACIDADWLAAKVLKSINKVEKPGISWVYGAPQNLDWRATFNRNESLQEHWKQFLGRTGKMQEGSFDPWMEIFKARYTQDWVLVYTYKADPTEKVELVYIQPKTKTSILATASDAHESMTDPSARQSLRDKISKYMKFRGTSSVKNSSTLKRRRTLTRIKGKFGSCNSMDSPNQNKGYLSIHSDRAIHQALGMTFDLIKGAIDAIEGYQALRNNPDFPYAEQLAVDVLDRMLKPKPLDQFKRDASGREELSKPEVKKFLPSEEPSTVTEFHVIRAKAFGAMESLKSNIQDTILAQRASGAGSSSSDENTSSDENKCQHMKSQHLKILSDKNILTTSTRMLLMLAIKQIEDKFLEMKKVAAKMFGEFQAQTMIKQAPDLLALYEKVVALREQDDTWQKSSEQLLGDKALASALSNGSFHRKPARPRPPIPDMAPNES